MNQLRTFLIFAWILVATILWMEWNKEQRQPVQATAAQAITPTTQPQGLPAPTLAGAVPTASTAPVSGQPAMQAASATEAAAPTFTLSNDVLRIVLDGGNVRRAELLRYRTSRAPDAPLVRLFDDTPKNFYIAQSGWTSDQGAPGHNAGFVAEQSATDLRLADGAKNVTASFVWTGADGVTIRRTYTLGRGEYALKVRDDIVNRGAKPWTGYIYRPTVNGHRNC
jgi:YidC/Oxa1 family membrane protein insertase